MVFNEPHSLGPLRGTACWVQAKVQAPHSRLRILLPASGLDPDGPRPRVEVDQGRIVQRGQNDPVQEVMVKPGGGGRLRLDLEG